MALAGHATAVYVTTTDTTPGGSDELDGIKSASLNRVRDELETTDFDDSTGAKTFILGLKGAEIQVSGDYESADTALGRLNTAFGDGTSVWLHIYWNGSAGHKVECKVPTFNLSSGVGETVKVDVTCRATGAVSAV